MKNSGEVLNKLKARGFIASSLTAYDFSTPYTTLPYNIIKDKLFALTEHTFQREKVSYLAYNENRAFFTSEVHKNHNLWSCQGLCDALLYLLDNIFIR